MGERASVLASLANITTAVRATGREGRKKRKKGDHRSNKTGDRPRQPVNLLGSAEVVVVCALVLGVGLVGRWPALVGSAQDKPREVCRCRGRPSLSLFVPRCGAASPREPRLYLSPGSRVPGSVASASAGAPNWRTDGEWRLENAGSRPLGQSDYSGCLQWLWWDADGWVRWPEQPRRAEANCRH